MFPDFGPVHRRVPAFDNNRTERDTMAAPREMPSEHIIVRKTIGENIEAAESFQNVAAREHHGTQRKTQRLDVNGLQNLAPKIGVDGDGFPTHGGRRRISDPVKTIDEADFW